MNQFSSVQSLSRVRLCDPMNCSTPGLPVHHQLPEFTQTLFHLVSDAIQPSHPLSSPSPPALNPSQNQSLFQWVNSSHEVAKVLEFQLQHHSFQRNPRVDLLQNGLVGSPCSLGASISGMYFQVLHPLNPLTIMYYSSLSLFKDFDLKSILSDINIAIPVFFLFSLA